MKIAVLIVLLTASLSAESRRSRLWRWSVAALAAGNTADAVSTLGQSEGNPVLGGTFGARAMATKSGIVLGCVLFQAWLRRKHPETERPLAIANFATGGALGGLAVRNWNLGGRK